MSVKSVESNVGEKIMGNRLFEIRCVILQIKL